MTTKRVRVGEVLCLRRRPVVPEPDVEYVLIGVYSWGKGIFHRDPTLGTEVGNFRFFTIEPGDLVLSNIQAWEGAIALATGADAGTIGTHRFLTYTPADDRIDTSWARWFFLSEPGMALIRQAAPGTTMRNRTLAIERFENLEVPLPPIDEQRLVASRISRAVEHVGLLRSPHARLASTAMLLENARSSQLFGSTEEPRLTLEEVAEIRGGIQRTPSREAFRYPVRYLTVAHVGRDRISFEDPRYFEVPPDELEHRALHKGDVLIIEGNGSADQVGRAALFRGEVEPCVHQNHVIRARPNPDLIHPEFLNAYLNSPAGREAVQAQARTSSGLRSLSVGRIKRIEVPVPTLAEQSSVVESCTSLARDATAFRALVDQSTVLLDAIVPSLLNNAFGQLS